MATQKQIEDATALLDKAKAEVTDKKEKAKEISDQIKALEQYFNIAIAEVKKAEARLEVRKEDLAALS